MRMPPLHGKLAGLAVAVYGISFLLPVSSTGCCSSEMPVLGFMAFLSAPLMIPALFTGHPGDLLNAVLVIAGWTPNPLFWMSFCCLVRRKTGWAACGGLMASLIALIWLWMETRLGIGYYVWLTSLVLLGGSALLLCVYPPRPQIDANALQDLSTPFQASASAVLPTLPADAKPSTDFKPSHDFLLTGDDPTLRRQK
jgi:hypothetical protein